VAIMSGKIHVGLSEENLERLAQDTSAIKTSRRDLPYVISKVSFFIVDISLLK